MYIYKYKYKYIYAPALDHSQLRLYQDRLSLRRLAPRGPATTDHLIQEGGGSETGGVLGAYMLNTWSEE